MGWALENLGSERCREIAESVMRVEKIYGTKLHGFCPVHGDQKSASAFYNFELDSGGCLSCGEKWDIIKLWCLVNGHEGDDIKAFRAEFDNDYTGGASKTGSRKVIPLKKPAPVPTPPAPEVFIPEEDLAALPALPDDMINEFKAARGWAPAVMAQLDLRLFTDSRGNWRVAIPVRTVDGQLGNIRLYQRGADQFKVISWYDQKCKACGGAWKIAKGKAKVCKECGASPNDYGRTRLFPPPSAWSPGVIWLCEGEPDTICALSMGINAVTQTAGCGTWTELFSEAFAGRDVVICYDADQAGHKGALKTAEALADYAKSVRIILWPELMGAV